VNAVAWSPGGHQLASGSWDRTIRLREPKSGETVYVLTGHGGVTSVAWSPDGRKLASGSIYNVATLWNTNTRQLVQTLQGHAGPLLSLAWLSYQSVPLLVTSSADKTIRLWESTTGKPTRIIEGHTGFVNCVAMTSDQQLMASKGGRRITPFVSGAATPGTRLQ
jgi:WD40 repeat protein